MSSPDNNQRDEIPTDIAERLEGRNDRELRDIIQYAQQLLQEHSDRTQAIEPREGEEIVRMEDHGAYTFVVVERPEATGVDRGPFAYRVSWEPSMPGEEGRYRWHYLGRVDAPGGDE